MYTSIQPMLLRKIETEEIILIYFFSNLHLDCFALPEIEWMCFTIRIHKIKEIVSRTPATPLHSHVSLWIQFNLRV